MENKEYEYNLLIIKLDKAINLRNNLSGLISIIIGILSAIIGYELMWDVLDSHHKKNNTNMFSLLGLFLCYALCFWQILNAIFIGNIQFPPHRLIEQRENYINKVLIIKRDRYKRALNGKNKKNALTYGRDYYKYLRGGELSIYDEAAIKNDIDTM